MTTRQNLLARPPRLPMVFPSILGADFTRLESECRDVLDAGAEALHIDVMDGHFVPNLSMGPDIVRALRRRFADVPIDVHLMVEHPNRFVQPFADAGADHLSFHIEVAVGRAEHHEHALIQQIHTAGCAAGIVINPGTPAEAIFHVLDKVDMVLVMSVQPGFAGQKFMPHVLDKVQAIKQRLRPTTRLEIDGGLSDGTVGAALKAGADVIVAASALFNAPDRAAMIRNLRGQ